MSGEATNGPQTLGMVTYPLPLARVTVRSSSKASLLQSSGTHGVDLETILPPTVKHRSRMLWHIADHKARQTSGKPAALGIPLDGPNGAFTETSIGNFLAVIDGTVTTPPRATVLDGISLRVTEALCRHLGIPFAEERLPLSRMGEFSEVMLTGTGLASRVFRNCSRLALNRCGSPGPARCSPNFSPRGATSSESTSRNNSQVRHFACNLMCRRPSRKRLCLALLTACEGLSQAAIMSR